jgi:hypothetical protein
VPEGTHEVEMSFSAARGYRVALVTTVAAVLLCLGLVLAPRRRERAT